MTEEQRPTGAGADADPLGPPPAALYDDDPLGPPPAALYDDPPSGHDGPPSGPDRPHGQGPGPHGLDAGPQQTLPADSRSLAAIAHLSAFATFAGVPSFIGPLVIWLFLRERDRFVAEAAREALNFNLSLLIYAVTAVVAMIVTLGLGLIVLIPVALVAFPAWLVLTVLAAVKAADGEVYRYPLTMRLVN